MKRSWMRRIFAFALAVTLPGFGIGQGIAAPDAVAAPEPGIAPGWLVQHADAPLTFSDMSQHSLRLDSASNPHVAYGGDHLYYAYLDTGGLLHTETADAAWNVGSGAALALDAAGKAHISYYDSGNQDLKYATNKSGAWQVQTVASVGYVGRYSDIAIDFWGDPTIVYFDSTNNQLRYVYYDSEYGGWGNDVAAATGVYDPGHNGWFSFALETSDVTPNKPHISFYKAATAGNLKGTLYYTTYANGWVTNILESCSADDLCHAGEYNSLALDPGSKRPSVAYYYDGVPGPMLIYQAFTGTTWSTEYLWSSLPKYVTLGMDSTGKAHITYQDGGFMYTRQPGPGTDPWTSPYVIDGSATSGQWSSMALPVLGILAKALHYDTQKRQLLYVGHERGSWLAPSVIANQGREVGECSSLAIDRLGRSHTSYWDDTNKRLLYARYDGGLPWFKNTIVASDASGTVGCFSVMVVDPATNLPVVGLVKGTSLYYATYNAAMETWQSPILVDSGLDISSYSYQHFGMVLRADGKPVFAYIKGNNLIYTSWIGMDWNHATVTASPAGTHVALALDSGNRPHILFDQNFLMKNATNPGTGWVIESLGEAGKNYYGAAVAAGPSGQVAAAFLSTGGYQMHYASRACSAFTQQCTWTMPVMADITCEEHFSLALDAQGTPHMACTALTSSGFDLHYITRAGSAWVVQAVDTFGAVGLYPALALSPSGRPRISYQDILNHDLKFAQAQDKVYLPDVRR